MTGADGNGMAMMLLAYRGVMGRYQGSERRRTEWVKTPRKGSDTRVDEVI